MAHLKVRAPKDIIDGLNQLDEHMALIKMLVWATRGRRGLIISVITMSEATNLVKTWIQMLPIN